MDPNCSVNPTTFHKVGSFQERKAPAAVMKAKVMPAEFILTH